jgi:hypothetical protein
MHACLPPWRVERRWIEDRVAWILNYIGSADREEELAAEFEHMSSTFRFTG